MKILNFTFLAIILCCLHTGVFSQTNEYSLVENIHYYDGSVRASDPYIDKRCKLDVYYPEHANNADVIVWFHGGGLEMGNKHIPEGLLKKGLIVVSVNYRLHPKVKAPAYIKDAAAAVAWVFKNIKHYKGNPSRIFVSGHSAGGYLASMIGLDKSYLATHSIDANDIAGLIPLSGHTITHFTIRKETGIEGTQPIVDKFAPLFHVRKDAPPMLLITGDRELELLGRYEENAYFYRMMKVVEHNNTRIHELDGYGHDVIFPSTPIMIQFIEETAK